MLSLGPWKQGQGSPPSTPLEEQGLGTRVGCPGGQRRREATGEWSGKAEKGQARLRYFNLINDRTPLRVCFNNQDTLQQVDRMFAVNLHMSSVRAVSINNVRECAGCAAASPGAQQVAPLSLLQSGGSCQRRKGVGELQARSFLSGEFPGLLTKVRAPDSLLREATAGVI